MCTYASSTGDQFKPSVCIIDLLISRVYVTWNKVIIVAGDTQNRYQNILGDVLFVLEWVDMSCMLTVFNHYLNQY